MVSLQDALGGSGSPSYNQLRKLIEAINEGGGGGGAVSSVNGQTGAVVLDADDVHARPDDWTPTAADVGTLTEGQIEALIEASGGGLFRGAFSPVALYNAGEVVAYQGELYTAAVTVEAPDSVSYVGKQTGTYTTTNPSIPLPAGTAAGDLVVFSSGNGQYDGISPASEWTRLTNADHRGGACAKLVTQAEVTAGVVNPITNGGIYGGLYDVRAFRGANLPSSSVAAVYTDTAGALTVAPGSIPMVVWSASRNNGTATNGGTPTGAVSTASTSLVRQQAASNPQTLAVAHGPAGQSLAAAHTTLVGLNISSGPIIAGWQFVIPMASGFNAAQWVKLTGVKRAAVADANYTALAADDIVEFTSLTTNRTITLPAASSVSAGKTLVIRNATANGSTITVSRAGSDTIDGATSFTFAGAYSSMRLISNGSNAWGIERDASKVDKASGANKLYGIKTDGSQGTWDLSNDPGGLTVVMRAGNGAVRAAAGSTDSECATMAQLNGRLSAAQRTAIDALDPGTATVADIVNALKAS